MRVPLVALALLLGVVPASAQMDKITDADTLVVNGTKYRLDAIDAPETDQKCIGTDGKAWACGQAATAALGSFVASKTVTCEQVDYDSKYKRQVGRCLADGVSIEDWLVREGWAIEFTMHSDGRFAADQRDARDAKRGIWASCFANPRDHRYTNKSTAELMGDCPTAAAAIARVRDELFGPGYFIKAKVFNWARQLATGLKGIYHTEGCASYGKMKTEADSHRIFFFASAALAEEQGFRKAKNCLTK